MGQVASDGCSNLSFLSSKPSITSPLLQSKPVGGTYDKTKTYVAIIVVTIAIFCDS